MSNKFQIVLFCLMIFIGLLSFIPFGGHMVKIIEVIICIDILVIIHIKEIFDNSNTNNNIRVLKILQNEYGIDIIDGLRILSKRKITTEDVKEIIFILNLNKRHNITDNELRFLVNTYLY